MTTQSDKQSVPGHTPGPWAPSPLSANVICGADDSDGEPTILAIVKGGKHGDHNPHSSYSSPGAAEGLANARLIAVAPELLEVAITLRLLLRLAALKFDFSLDGSEGMAQADAAIAKATVSK